MLTLGREKFSFPSFLFFFLSLKLYSLSVLDEFLKRIVGRKLNKYIVVLVMATSDSLVMSFLHSMYIKA